MIIKSYLAYPYEGKKEALIEAVSNISECEVVPSKNKDILIFILTAESKEKEQLLKQKIEAIESLRLLN